MVALADFDFAELEPLDCMPVIFGFGYIGGAGVHGIGRDPRGASCWIVTRHTPRLNPLNTNFTQY